MSIRIVCLTVAFGSAALGATAQSAATIELRPGEWLIHSQVWMDGREVLGALESASQQATDAILADVRAQMSPEERAEFDRNMAEIEAEQGDLTSGTECITPEDAEVPADMALERMLSSLYEPPWMCTFSNERADAQGFSLDYRCDTSRSALAEGHARFETTDTSYRMSIDGRSHAVNMETGEPLSSQIVQVRSLTTGEWVSEECSVLTDYEDE